MSGSEFLYAQVCVCVCVYVHVCISATLACVTCYTKTSNVQHTHTPVPIKTNTITSIIQSSQVLYPCTSKHASVHRWPTCALSHFLTHRQTHTHAHTCCQDGDYGVLSGRHRQLKRIGGFRR